MAMPICDINLTSGSWDWTNQTLTSSWHRRDNGRYPTERNPPRLYTTSVLATIMPRLYCETEKNKASGDFFSLSCCYQKNVIFFQTALLYLKVISNIVSGNNYWERHIKNVIKLNPDVCYPLCKIMSSRRLENAMPYRRPYMVL